MNRMTYILGIVMLSGVLTGCRTESDLAARETIGVYDSRCIAVAYAGSPMYEVIGKTRQIAYEKAKANGDKATMKEINDAAVAKQRQFHRQGFSTAPVENILAKYAKKIDALKEKYHLSALVSKWDTVGLKQHPNAKEMDVTNELVDIIGPDTRSRKFVSEIHKHKPLTEAELNKQLKAEH